MAHRTSFSSVIRLHGGCTLLGVLGRVESCCLFHGIALCAVGVPLLYLPPVTSSYTNNKIEKASAQSNPWATHQPLLCARTPPPPLSVTG